MTKEYYLENAKQYINETRNAKVDYTLFEKYLMPGSHILDLGSGSGRDCFHFNYNFKVSALDYIPEFINQVRFCCEETILMDMREYEVFDTYDAIWAHDSLVHLSKNEIIAVLNSMYYALHGSGVMYCTFNYGDFSGMISDRYFTYMDEARFKLILDQTNFKLAETAITFETINNTKTKTIAFVLAK